MQCLDKLIELLVRRRDIRNIDAWISNDSNKQKLHSIWVFLWWIGSIFKRLENRNGQLEIDIVIKWFTAIEQWNSYENMNSLQAPSLQSLMDSDRGSNDSLLAESLQLDLDEVFEILYCFFSSYFRTQISHLTHVSFILA